MAKILFECDEADKAIWIETAKRERLTLSAWIRRTLAERAAPIASSGGGDLVREDGMAARSVSAYENLEPRTPVRFPDIPPIGTEQPRMSAAEYQAELERQNRLREVRSDFKPSAKPKRRR